MGRKPCCAKEGMNKGAWTALEDKILIQYIKENGEGKWRNTPKLAGLKRCGKSCRLRWLNYLRPDIKRGNISRDEEDLIVRLHKLLGNRWSLIAGRLPGRTDNEIKNYWNTNLSKKTRQLNKVLDDERKPKLMKSSPTRTVNLTRAWKGKGGTIMAATREEDMALGTSSDDMTNVVPSMKPTTIGNMAMLESEPGSSLLNTTMDFDMGEICLSDILGLEDYAQNVTALGDTNPTMFPVYIPENFAGNWRENEYGVNKDYDFQALATFFESPDEWLYIDQN